MVVPIKSDLLPETNIYSKLNVEAFLSLNDMQKK